MSEYMFGGPDYNRRFSAAEADRLDRICREEGGHGFTCIDDSHGTAEGGRWIGWFSGPNLGHPFDADLSRRVLARVKEEGGAP